MRIRIFSTIKEWFLLLLFYLLLFQNPLSEWKTIFGYVDECIALIGPVLYIYRVFDSGKIRLKRENMRIVCSLTIFVIVGLLGNIIFEYQAAAGVLEDVYVDLKFFMSILTGYELLIFCKIENIKNVFLTQTQFISVILFVLMILDLAFQIFEGNGVRYGIRVIQLFFEHPTYLASAAVLLISILTLFYEKKNDIFLLFSLLTLFFTLRGKAIAGVAVYAMVYFLLMKQRKKLRFWHMLLLGLGSIVVAWEQFAFYYIELEGTSARSVLTRTAFLIAKDYFPIGTGFGTYASHVAAERYSPLYYTYGLSAVHGLSEGNMRFGSDTFWPIIIGQTGVSGTICYINSLFLLFKRVLNVRMSNLYAYCCGIYIFTYLIISSTSESAFCNALSIPLAVILGCIYAIHQIEMQASQ